MMTTMVTMYDYPECHRHTWYRSSLFLNYPDSWQTIPHPNKNHKEGVTTNPKQIIPIRCAAFAFQRYVVLKMLDYTNFERIQVNHPPYAFHRSFTNHMDLKNRERIYRPSSSRLVVLIVDDFLNLGRQDLSKINMMDVSIVIPTFLVM
jgi:hypothetical protein